MKALAEQISDIDGVNIYGRVVGVRGLMVEIAGPIHAMSVGARIVIETGGNRFIPAEVIGFTGNNAVVMPFAGLEGVRRGCRAVIANAAGQALGKIEVPGMIENNRSRIKKPGLAKRSSIGHGLRVGSRKRFERRLSGDFADFIQDGEEQLEIIEKTDISV